jgi:hypothetical protein
MYCWLVTTYMVSAGCGRAAASDGVPLFMARATMCLYWLSLSFTHRLRDLRRHGNRSHIVLFGRG